MILSARSPVFKAMLTSDMVERTQGVIHIEVDRLIAERYIGTLFEIAEDV